MTQHNLQIETTKQTDSKVKLFIRGIRNKFEFYLCHNVFRKTKSSAISIGKNSRFRYCTITVYGENNNIIFGNNCNMHGLNILIKGNNNTIEFCDNVTVNASRIQPTVINAIGGTNISIGANSLLSNNIEIHTSDYHGIYNEYGVLVNPDKDIVIGSSVWIGLGCTILKGSVIPDGTVIGAGSLIAGSYFEQNTIIAGNPAKVIKHKIFWDKQRDSHHPVPDTLKKKWGETSHG